ARPTAKPGLSRFPAKFFVCVPFSPWLRLGGGLIYLPRGITIHSQTSRRLCNLREKKGTVHPTPADYTAQSKPLATFARFKTCWATDRARLAPSASTCLT